MARVVVFVRRTIIQYISKNTVKAATNAAIPPFITKSFIDGSPLLTAPLLPADSAVSLLFREGDDDNVVVESLSETTDTGVIILDT